jgi:predicted lipoprotein with Yx(FWY)xxD motif
MRTFAPIAAYAVAALLTACASPPDTAGAPGKVEIRNTAILTDDHGMSLYTLDDDPRGASVCYARCARAWPPLLAEANDQPTGRYSIIQRDDGNRQWAYDGQPLYLWEKDKKPGDITGHNVGDVWRLAVP